MEMNTAKKAARAGKPGYYYIPQLLLTCRIIIIHTVNQKTVFDIMLNKKHCVSKLIWQHTGDATNSGAIYMGPRRAHNNSPT